YENGLFEKTTYHYNNSGLPEEEDYVTNLSDPDESTDQDIYVYLPGNYLAYPKSKQVKYSYDKVGNKIQESILYDGKVSVINDYTYDSHGNWVRRISDNIKNKEITEREINYFGEKNQESVLDSVVKLKQKEKLRDKFCNKDMAIQNIKMWMNNNYPDWKIESDFIATETDDCIYNVEFTAINPHYAGLGVEDKEIIIIQFSYAAEDYSRGYFKSIRGTLY
ncbi:MAG: hypothetical protein ACRDE8_05060, partial [Ginsengibacter sp.]